MSIQHVALVLDARDPRLSGCRKLVLVTLANRTNENGICWPSQQLLADECGISIRALADHLKGLETDGFVERTTKHLGQGNGSRTYYRLSLNSLKLAPENIAPAEFAPANFSSCTGSTPHVTNLHEPSVTIEDKSSIVAANPEQPSKKRSGKVRGPSRKTALPESWYPGPAVLAYASQMKFTREEINHETDQFRASAVANGRRYADWDAAFRTWLGNCAKWRAERAGRQAPGFPKRNEDRLGAFDRLADRLQGSSDWEDDRGQADGGTEAVGLINITPARGTR